MHNEDAVAYKKHEEIKMPYYENWEEYIRLYPSQSGIKKEPYEAWVNPNPNNIRNPLVRKNTEGITRNERKTLDSLKKGLETGMLSDADVVSNYEKKLKQHIKSKN